jgi:hypothetical protein
VAARNGSLCWCLPLSENVPVDYYCFMLILSSCLHSTCQVLSVDIQRNSNFRISVETVARYGNCQILPLNVQGRPPLLSSGQSFWLQIQRSRVRLSELPDFLRSSGSGTGFTQPREKN